MRAFLQQSGLDGPLWLQRTGQMLDALVRDLAEVVGAGVREHGQALCSRSRRPARRVHRQPPWRSARALARLPDLGPAAVPA
jgi:hypothetical protein